MTELMRLLFSGAITNHMNTVVLPPSSSLIDILQWRALHQPDSLAYAFLRDGEVEEARLTYAELDLRVRALAARLLAEAPPGARALLLYPPGLDFVIAFWACLAAGVIAVPAYPPGRLRQAHRVKSILADSQARLVLTTAALEQHCVREAEGPQSRALVGCGPPGLGEQLAIVDPQTFEPCPHDRVGEIWVAGLHVAQGYWQRPVNSSSPGGSKI